MKTSYAWDTDFPKGYGHTSISYLKRCTGFKQAKNGDFTAARQVVRQCVKRNRINMMRKLFPNAVLLPIMTKNMLPLALATEIGLPIHTDVEKADNNQRKHMCAMERLVYKPEFQGYIPPGIEFIIVDDIVTQGSTIAELRKYVLSQGSTVVAIVALAYSIGSTIIAPKEENVCNMSVKFGSPIVLILNTKDIANDPFEMTNSQVRYLLRFKCYENVINKIESVSRTALFA